MSTNFLTSQPKLNHFMMGSKYNEANLRWHSKQLLFWQSQSAMSLLTLTVLVVPVLPEEYWSKMFMEGSREFCLGGDLIKCLFIKVINIFHRGSHGPPSRSNWTQLGPITPRGGSVPVFLRKPHNSHLWFSRGSRPPCLPLDPQDVLD